MKSVLQLADPVGSGIAESPATIRKRTRAVGWKLFEIQAALISDSATMEILLEAKQWIQPRHLEEVIEERTNDGRCGYPCCRKPITKPDEVAPMKIAYKEKRVYEVGRSKLFCGADCLREATLYQNSLDDSNPVFREIAGTLAEVPEVDDVQNILEIISGEPKAKEEEHSDRKGGELDGGDRRPPPRYESASVDETGKLNTTFLTTTGSKSQVKVKIGVQEDVVQTKESTIEMLMRKMNRPMPQMSSFQSPTMLSYGTSNNDGATTNDSDNNGKKLEAKAVTAKLTAEAEKIKAPLRLAPLVSNKNASKTANEDVTSHDKVATRNATAAEQSKQIVTTDEELASELKGLDFSVKKQLGSHDNERGSPAFLPQADPAVPQRSSESAVAGRTSSSSSSGVVAFSTSAVAETVKKWSEAPTKELPQPAVRKREGKGKQVDFIVPPAGPAAASSNKLKRTSAASKAGSVPVSKKALLAGVFEKPPGGITAPLAGINGGAVSADGRTFEIEGFSLRVAPSTVLQNLSFNPFASSSSKRKPSGDKNNKIGTGDDGSDSGSSDGNGYDSYEDENSDPELRDTLRHSSIARIDEDRSLFLVIWTALDDLFGHCGPALFSTVNTTVEELSADDSDEERTGDDINKEQKTKEEEVGGEEGDDDANDPADQLDASLLNAQKALSTLLDRGFASAEKLLLVDRYLNTDARQKYYETKVHLLTLADLFQPCPSLNNSEWTLLCLVLVDSIVSFKRLVPEASIASWSTFVEGQTKTVTSSSTRRGIVTSSTAARKTLREGDVNLLRSFFSRQQS